MFQLRFSFDAALRVVSCCLVQLWFSFDSDLCGQILSGSELVQLVVDSLLMVQLWFRLVQRLFCFGSVWHGLIVYGSALDQMWFIVVQLVVA